MIGKKAKAQNEWGLWFVQVRSLQFGGVARGNSVMYLNDPDQKRRPAHVTMGWEHWEQHTSALQPLTPGQRAVVGQGVR